MIEAGCKQGGVVLDPFLGSGTTAIVAKSLNRDYVGIEINENYAKISRRTIKNCAIKYVWNMTTTFEWWRKEE